MKSSAINRKFAAALLVTLGLVFFISCAGASKNARQQAFLEKWSTMAEDSKGHSPSAEAKKIDMDSITEKQQASDVLASAEMKSLPTKPINLSMRQAQLRSVLRAMAKSVDLNILIKDDLEGVVSVDFRGVPWDQAFTGLLRTHALSYVWEGKVLLVKTVDDIEQDLKRKIQLRDIRWVEPLLQPVVIKINYANAKNMVETLQEFLTRDKDGKLRGSVRYDEHSNSLIISAIHEDLVRMLGIIEQIDKPTPQILIRANIVETTKNVARDLGIMWGGFYNRKDFTATGGGSAPLGISGESLGLNFPAALDSATPLGSLGLLFGKIGGNILEIQLQALQQDNLLNILSSPSITTLDNQKAYTESGERVPYVSREIDAEGRETRTVKFEDVVLRLEITPHVIDDNHLKMTILVKKDEVDPLRNVEGNPFIIKKQTETVLIVEDGETIVISGLTKQRLAQGDAGLPLLQDIPLMGYLFKAHGKSDAMEEVLIFITPRILPPAPHVSTAPVNENDAAEPVRMEDTKKEEESAVVPEEKTEPETAR
ncbi:MAG TPA: type IV pilus secretin PilQ [Deltaproteobacteria bacterium]|mgnify:CR=1 FL=1|nr:type IV pilus secretin PilQ [Deltaproteobacteria bacterium]